MNPYRTGPDAASDGLHQAAELINENMTWAHTPEGDAFWFDVCKRLKAHSAAAFGKQLVPDYAGHGVDLVTPLPNNPSKAVANAVFKETKIHVYYKGASLCGLPADVRTWPAGATRVGMEDRIKCTCPECKMKITPGLVKEFEGSAAKIGATP